MKFLLRFVDGTPVALCEVGLGQAEMLATRYDLFEYSGGVAWGYKGSGVQHLAHAIAAKAWELTADRDSKRTDIPKWAYSLVDNVLCYLDGDKPHDISIEDVVRIKPS